MGKRRARNPIDPSLGRCCRVGVVGCSARVTLRTPRPMVGLDCQVDESDRASTRDATGLAAYIAEGTIAH